MEEMKSYVMPDQYLTTRQVATLLNITIPTLYKWTQNGSIRGYKFGCRVRYKKEDVVNSLKEITHPTKQENEG